MVTFVVAGNGCVVVGCVIGGDALTCGEDLGGCDAECADCANTGEVVGLSVEAECVVTSFNDPSFESCFLVGGGVAESTVEVPA